MGTATTIEIILDWVAAAWLSAAIATAGWIVGAPLAASSTGALVVGGLAYRALASLRNDNLPLRPFDLVDVVWSEEKPEELLLTAEMVAAPASDELVLDDVLAAVEPDSRVVQLFAAPSVPTAGELKLRIDRHLQEGRRAALPISPPDASQALYDALADLRRSLA